VQQCRELRTENRDLDKRNTQSEARPPPARPATAPRRQHHEGHRPLDASNPRRVDGIHVLHLLDCAQHLDDLPDVEAVAGRPSGAFPCSYEPLATHDRRSPCDAKAVALTASGSFAAADGVLGRRRDGPRHAHRARALRAWSATMAHKQRPSRGLRVGPDPACPDEESGSWWRSALSKPTFSGPRGFKRRQRRASRALAVSALRGAQKAKSRGKGNPEYTVAGFRSAI
jgi:hypothetical protein